MMYGKGIKNLNFIILTLFFFSISSILDKHIVPIVFRTHIHK
ncbi:unnamed protein product [Nezara viridula]|uniref:Uncharacterized protein n=1 Tax=Nezara viridula TaxID=85310 RepID=A0A9P0E1R3_NEZVI|nr:unnamed protein product [Nezara viridula]